MKIIDISFVTAFCFVLLGCGGGTEDSSESPRVTFSISNPEGEQIVSAPSEVSGTLNAGGTVSNPSSVSFDSYNVLTDSFNNYFSITVSEKSQIYISMILENGLTKAERSRCALSSDSDVILKLNGEKASCDYKAFIEVEAGTHELHFNIPANGGGYFSIGKITNEQYTFLEADGKGGLPNTPKYFLMGGQNEINKDMLFNFYAYEGVAGDRVVISTYLNEVVETGVKSLCNVANAENRARLVQGESIILNGMMGLSVNGGVHNCSESLDFVLPENGVYIFHLMFANSSSRTYPVDGYFLVDVQK